MVRYMVCLDSSEGSDKALTHAARNVHGEDTLLVVAAFQPPLPVRMYAGNISLWVAVCVLLARLIVLPQWWTTTARTLLIFGKGYHDANANTLIGVLLSSAAAGGILSLIAVNAMTTAVACVFCLKGLFNVQ